MINQSFGERLRGQLLLKWGLTISIFSFNILSSFSQKLHFLSAINTDNYYRLEKRSDAEKINKIANNISKYLNIEKLTYDFGDSLNYNPETIKLTLNSLSVVPCSDDVVWFHYSGDGYNMSNSSMPTLRLFGGDLDIKDIERIVVAKTPKLLLITIDASNLPTKDVVFSNSQSNYRTIRKKPMAIKPVASFISSREIAHYQTLENYHTLFKDFENSKVIIITSSTKGEESFSDSYKGSFLYRG